MKKLDYLENYDVVALDEKKTKEIDGGLGPLFWTLAFAFAYDLASNGKKCQEALEAGLKGEPYPG